MIQPIDNGEFKPLPVRLQQKMFGEDPRFLFGRLGVHGDGTCFFHSLCAALDHNDYLDRDSQSQQELGHQYRSDFTTHITPERLHKFKAKHNIKETLSVEELKQKFHDDKHWADETMIKLVSDVLKCNILFIDTDKNRIYCGVRGEKDEPLIVILWVNHSHFEPMCRVFDEQLDARKVKVQFKFSLFDPADQEVVQMMMSNYDAQCST